MNEPPSHRVDAAVMRVAFGTVAVAVTDTIKKPLHLRLA